jgi:hypothetical protein
VKQLEAALSTVEGRRLKHLCPGSFGDFGKVFEKPLFPIPRIAGVVYQAVDSVPLAKLAGEIPSGLGRTIVGLGLNVMEISPEDLLGSLIAEAYFDVARGELAHIELGKHCSADDRLVQVIHEAHKVVWEIGSVYLDQLQLQAERSGGGFLVRSFITDSLAAEVNAETGGGLSVASGIGSNSARFDPFAKEDANGDVGHQLILHHFGQLIAEFLDDPHWGFVEVAEVIYYPIGTQASTMGTNFKIFSSAELSDIPEEGALKQSSAQVEILIDALKVGLTRNIRILEQSLDFAREDNAATVIVVVNLFDTEWIAGQSKAALDRVPKSEPKYPSYTRQGIWAGVLHEVKKCFCVGCPPETMASGT